MPSLELVGGTRRFYDAQQSSTLAAMFFNHRACVLVLSYPRKLGMPEMVDLR